MKKNTNTDIVFEITQTIDAIIEADMAKRRAASASTSAKPEPSPADAEMAKARVNAWLTVYAGCVSLGMDNDVYSDDKGGVTKYCENVLRFIKRNVDGYASERKTNAVLRARIAELEEANNILHAGINRIRDSLLNNNVRPRSN